MLRWFRFLPVLLASYLPACGLTVSDVQGEWTEGTEGRLRFAFDLAPDQEALSPGTEVHVLVEGPGSDGAIDVTSGDPDVATFRVERFCTCTSDVEDRYTVRSIAPRQSCLASEEKRCENVVSAFAHAEGDTELLVLDDVGELLDRAKVKVRERLLDE